MTDTKKAAKRTATTRKRSGGFTDEERGAMKERAKEVRAERSGSKEADDASAVQAKIAEMGTSDRVMAERIHALVTATAPDLSAKLWYGMPAYAKAGKVVCFFQPAEKFKSRYATLGFNDTANLDQGDMWPTAFALTKVTEAEEKKIGTLVRKAAG